MKTRRKISRGFEGMRSHYDFQGGVRGKHARAYAEGTNRVTLEPDLASMFPDDRSVNDALRVIAEVAKRQVASKSRRRRKSS